MELSAIMYVESRTHFDLFIDASLKIELKICVLSTTTKLLAEELLHNAKKLELQLRRAAVSQIEDLAECPPIGVHTTIEGTHRESCLCVPTKMTIFEFLKRKSFFYFALL